MSPTETPFDKINRLQQRLNLIDDQIDSKRSRMAKYDGPLLHNIEKEVERLLTTKEEIKCEIAVLKGLSINLKQQVKS